MKLNYEKPFMNVEMFVTCGVITTSDNDNTTTTEVTTIQTPGLIDDDVYDVKQSLNLIC